MTLVLLYLFLAFMTLSGVVLLKAYTHIPPRELKRRARAGDELAGVFFKVASYGPHTEVLLWALIGLSAAGFFIVVDHAMSPVAALLASVALLWLSFAWIPHTPLSTPSLWLARLFAPAIAWLLRVLFVPMNWFVKRTGRWRMAFHTGLFEKDDLIELLSAQAGQPDSRISSQALTLAVNSLTFGDKMVRDVMAKRSTAYMVSADEPVGPVLLTELHASGHHSFPVYQGKKTSGEIIGTLYLRDVQDAKPTGTVRNHVRNRMHYLHDETSLDAALNVFLRTKQHMYMVVNSLEEVVGVVTIDDILEQIVGESLTDEFDTYDNPQAVAQHTPSRAARSHPSSAASTDASPRDETVVESDRDAVVKE